MAIRLLTARFGEAWDLALPEGRLALVALSGRLDLGPPGDALDALHADERGVAASMPARRARTWVGGRLALRRAIEASGLGAAVASAPILGDDRGAPALPAAVRGSIAHKDEIACALAAPAGSVTLGVDVELPRALAAPLERRVLTPREQAELSVLDDDARALERTRRFAAKEAIYKAIDPHLRRWVGFLEVELEGEGDRYAVSARLGPAEPQLLVEARAIDLGDVVVAVATARRRP